MAVKWIETNLILPEGDTFGQPFMLRRDQKKFLWEWYSYCGRCGHWRYTEGVKGAATGDGKTSFIAAIAILEFAGPPQIRPSSPIVVVAAVSWEQANELFRKAGQMVGGRGDEITEAPLCGMFHVFDARIVYKDGKPGMIERVAAVASSNEGGLPTLLLCDEVHEWGDPGSNKARLMTVVGKSLNKRKTARGPGRMLSLSTAGFDKQKSLLGKIYQRGKLAEYSPHSDPKFLFDWREGDPSLDPEDPDDRRQLIIQSSKAAGVLWDVEARVRAWRKPDMPPHEWLRYYANQWVDVAEDSWLADYPSAWDHCRGTWETLPENPFTVGVDMSMSRDTTAVVRVEKLQDDRFAVMAKIWRKETSTGKIDFVSVFDYVRKISKGTEFRGVVYDPKYFQLQAAQLEDEGYLCIQFDQAQPLDEPVLTPNGWVEIGSLSVGDEVIGADGFVTTVVDVQDKGIHSTYKVEFSDGSWTRCSENHLWKVKTAQERNRGYKGSVHSLHDIAKIGLKYRKASRHFIPVVETVEFSDKKFLLDSYVLGALLGDGCFTGDTTPFLTSIDSDIVERVSSNLPGGVYVKPASDGCHYRFSSPGGWKPNPLTAVLRDLGLYGTKCENKFIPSEYFLGSKQQRLDLLNGLMDTDGTCAQTGSASFFTTSPGLRDGIVELVRSLGGITHVRERAPRGKNKLLAYVISIGFDNGFNPFWLPRKAKLYHRTIPVSRAISSIVYLGEMPVRCISVDSVDGLYVTRDYIVTHNSPARMAPACGTSYHKILAQQIVHDGDPDLADQVKAAAKKDTDAGGFYLRKALSRRNIDSCVAMVMAVWELEQGPELPPPAGVKSGGAEVGEDFWRPKSRLFLG